MASKQQQSRSTDEVAREADAPAAPASEVDDSLEDAEEPVRPVVSVDLPATVHLPPDHELAVAIADIPVNPGQVGSDDTGTLSVMVGAMTPAAQHVDQGSGDHGSGNHGLGDQGTATGTDQADATYSRRDRLNGQVSARPEAAAMLTEDRLLDARKRKRPRPEGGWNGFVYAATLHLVNLGDSPAVRARKAVDARIDKQFEGGTRFVPILTRKGGVGKTTITALIGMALADVREDRIVAIDANPDRGTLAERVNKQTRATVRDIVTQAASINSFNDFSTMVSRDETRLDILASDTDPLLAQAFDEDD